MQYVNFHTHNCSDDKNIIAITNLFPHASQLISDKHYYTAGVHPWHASLSDIGNHLTTLQNLLKNPKVIGIGEIGLDKQKGPSVDLQNEVFVKQVSLAVETNRPIILHCIGAWNEIIQTKKSFGKELKCAIHGFSGSTQLANELLRNGFYLSYGKSILNSKKALSSLVTTPHNRILLETDDSIASIFDIYEGAAKILQIPIVVLKEIIFNNFQDFFRLSLPGK